ncbi:MAG: zinc metallopeptidase [Filifactoraceae bacterium]
MFYWDSSMLILIPAMILTMYAQSKVKSAYSKYASVGTKRCYSGAETARAILDQNNLRDVNIELIQGQLTDHYDPRTRVLRLSGEVYQGRTIAANAIAAHECGHAIQHAIGYQPLIFRNAIVPVVNIASNMSWPLIMLGFLVPSFSIFLTVGILMFSAAVFFQLITLPVEFNASSRALVELGNGGILESDEISDGKRVLNAAALTYVAAAASAILQLVRLLVIRNRRD